MAQLNGSTPAQILLEGRKKERIERGKAADIRRVLSPSSFTSIFYQAAHSQNKKEESATVTPLALA